MGLYEAFRTNGGPTTYDSLKTPVRADVLEIGFITAAVILAFSLLLILPGFNGKQILFQFVKIVIGVFVTASIMLSNYGQEWEVAHLSNAVMQYKAGYKGEIHADMEAKIGLRSINVTLKAVPNEHVILDEEREVSERINYNERFHWNSMGWPQGRLGFGPFAGLVSREFREGQRKGLPYPILWVAEYFTLDGEGQRYGRFYRQAGWYAHIMIWLAFPLWIITMILFYVVLHYGAYFSILTGLVLLIANMIYAGVRNINDLVVPIGTFEDGAEARLEFSWGSSFYLNLITGLLCVVIGAVVWIMHICCYDSVSNFFGNDALQEYDEYYLDSEELAEVKTGLPLMHTHDKAKSFKKSVRAKPRDFNGVQEAIELQDNGANNNRAPAPDPTPRRRYKLKNSVIGGKFQKSRKYMSRAPPPLPNKIDEEDDDMYVNKHASGGHDNNGLDRN